MKKETLIGVIVIAGIALFVIGGTVLRKISARAQEAERIADISNSKDHQTIDDLKKTIAAYEKQLERFVKASEKSGTYWKILATRLQDKNQHGEALEALQNAIQYNPEDTALFYMTGVSAAIMAKSELDFPGAAASEKRREDYYRLAEQGYLRSIELNGGYDKPLYGIGVLYVFELDRPSDAIPYLQRYIELNSRNPEGAADAMFVQARAYYSIGEYRRAIEQYDGILSASKNKNKLERAAELKQQTLWAMNG
ncbi:MAG: tetratricopeptide repeat protein [Treponema sp.]|jgi:tetratricopeptide (TPR) repeat protein|nr:tetratricopeptide repeat protein [Treponema sp.]